MNSGMCWSAVQTSGQSSCTEPMLLEMHTIWSFQTILNPWNSGYAEVQSQSFRPVEGSRLNLRYMNLKQWLKFSTIFHHRSFVPKLHFIRAGSATLTVCNLNPCNWMSLFLGMGLQVYDMLLKRPVFEASLSTHAPAAAAAAASETCPWS